MVSNYTPFYLRVNTISATVDNGSLSPSVGFTAQHPFIPIQFSGNPVTSPAIVAFPNAERQETGDIPVRSILPFAGLRIGFCEWTGVFAGTDFILCRGCMVKILRSVRCVRGFGPV
ncbi:hypothetical protein NPIL_344231 [Nephila pilipes]|uniref:Uncharacterized protein n=1 Tax=Nephila pilipes TaxID=299642 RepID=A0A8X6TRR2_NEPPI|nr:hypothetical protein NPIL_344231 [Nephila pilipes]